MFKRFVLIVALFVALTFLAIPAHADCDPKDPDCPITPPQSVEVNSDVILDEATTGDVDSPGALIPLESDFSSSGPEIINPVPFNSILAAPPNFESLDVRMRWQEPTDVSCGVQALGMAFDGIGDGSPSSSAMQTFLQSKGMMYDFGTGVEELAYAAQNFGYKGSVPFHGWGLDQLRQEIDSGQPVVVSIGANGEGQPGHFVTVTGVSPDGKWVSYNDPTLGKRVIPSDEFMRLWGLQGYSGVAVRKEVPSGSVDPIPWVAAAAGLMAIISQTPLALRRMGIGGRLIEPGAGSRRRRVVRPSTSRPRFLGRARSRPPRPASKPRKRNKGWVMRNRRRTPAPPTPEPSPIPPATTGTPTPPPTLTPSPRPAVTPTPTPVPYLRNKNVGSHEGTPYPGINRAYDKVNQAEDFELPIPSIISRAVLPVASKAVKYFRKARSIWNMTGVAFNELADDKFSVSVPGQPPGEKLSFRQKLHIAGTRYNQTNQPAVLSHSIRWKAVRGLGFTALISLATNAIDFTVGENRDKGLRSNEFAASTMVDFAQAGLIGVGAAVGVGAIVTGFTLSAPIWLVALATVGTGLLLGWIIDQIINTDKLKEKVATGLSAFGGIYENTKTIVNVGVQRIGQQVLKTARRVNDTVEETLQNIGDTINSVGKNLSKTAQNLKDKIGGIFGNLFGTGS